MCMHYVVLCIITNAVPKVHDISSLDNVCTLLYNYYYNDIMYLLYKNHSFHYQHHWVTFCSNTHQTANAGTCTSYNYTLYKTTWIAF